MSCTFSDIVKTTHIQERSVILSRIMIGRQLGMIIGKGLKGHFIELASIVSHLETSNLLYLGPAFNFILLKVNAKIGPYLLDNLSAPGVRPEPFQNSFKVALINLTRILFFILAFYGFHVVPIANIGHLLL